MDDVVQDDGLLEIKRGPILHDAWAEGLDEVDVKDADGRGGPWRIHEKVAIHSCIYFYILKNMLYYSENRDNCFRKKKKLSLWIQDVEIRAFIREKKTFSTS